MVASREPRGNPRDIQEVDFNNRLSTVEGDFLVCYFSLKERENWLFFLVMEDLCDHVTGTYGSCLSTWPGPLKGEPIHQPASFYLLQLKYDNIKTSIFFFKLSIVA